MKKTGIELLDIPTRFIVLCRSGEARPDGKAMTYITYQCDGKECEAQFSVIQKKIRADYRAVGYMIKRFYTMRIVDVCFYEVRIDSKWETTKVYQSVGEDAVERYDDAFLRLDDGVTVDDLHHHLTMMMLTRADNS